MKASSASRRGLSPRVRGNPCSRQGRVRLGRSIPARAGEPKGCPNRASASAVYPRACGGTVGTQARIVANAGLSPRVRGNLQAV